VDQFAPTIEIKVSFLRPARSDHRRGLGGPSDALPGVPRGDAGDRRR
jgi:hypothetical protein